MLSKSTDEEKIAYTKTIVLNTVTSVKQEQSCDESTKPVDNGNITFTENPTSVNQEYVENSNSCGFTCDEGYYWDGDSCESQITGDETNGYIFKDETGTIIYPTSCNNLLSGTTFKILGTGSPWGGSKFEDGVYWIKPDINEAFKVYCDMTTDGGGWILVLNYNHLGGTNPLLNIKTDSLPFQGLTSLGNDESGNSIYWGHASNSMMSKFNYTETRFYCKTSNHNRIMHFKTTDLNTISYFKTGIGSVGNIESNNTKLIGHNTYLPDIKNNIYGSKGEYSMTNFPFYKASHSHWGIKGVNNRWECDNYPNNYSYHTFHQIYIR